MDPGLLLVAGLAVILLLQLNRVRRQQRDIRTTQAAVEIGAEVLTAAGMIGTVVEVRGSTLVLQGEDGQRSRWLTGSVLRVLTDSDPASSRYRDPTGDDDVTGPTSPTSPTERPPVDEDGTPRAQD